MLRFFSATTAGGLMAILLAGCAAIAKQDTKSTEQLLSAAGFNIKPADTPEKLASLQVMKQHKLVRRELSNGQLRFSMAMPESAAVSTSATSRPISSTRS